MIKSKVLHIEDDVRAAASLKRLLTKAGFEVRSAHSGSEGLEIAQSSPPDLILLDHELPDIKGLEILHELRRRGIATRAIMLTGHYSITNVVSYIKAGACDLISKPADVDLIINKMRRAIAMESTINLTVSCSAPIFDRMLDPSEELLAKERSLKQWEEDLMRRESQFPLRMMRMRMIVLGVCVLTAVGFQVAHVLSGTSTAVFCGILFILLMIPWDTLQRFSGKLFGGELEVMTTKARNDQRTGNVK